MRTTILYLIAGSALALPGAAIAQTNTNASSVEYCNELGRIYSAQHAGFWVMTADKAVAVANCKTDPNASIATLEQAMKNARLDLPSRNQVASQKR